MECINGRCPWMIEGRNWPENCQHPNKEPKSCDNAVFKENQTEQAKGSAEFTGSVAYFSKGSGGVTAERLAQELDINVDRVRDALLSLEKKGLVQTV